MATQAQVQFVESLKGIRLPSNCLVILDQNLPLSIRSHFPAAIKVSAGEALKSVISFEVLAKKVLRRTQDRKTTLVAVGGGSLGDAVGFLASVLWRGVGLVHIPTTLLSMVDSAHGGKTALNLGAVKNQLGTFYPAQKVWIVKSILSSLPRDLRDEGLVELFKALLLKKPAMVRRYIRHGWSAYPLWESLQVAIKVKQGVVAKDPFETKGHREVLNLGHTLGHALESSTHLSHGHSVGWGLAAALVASEKVGLTDVDETLDFLFPLLATPKRWPTDAQLKKKMQGDKKQSQGKFRSILLPRLGQARVVSNLSPAHWTKFLHEARGRLSV